MASRLLAVALLATALLPLPASAAPKPTTACAITDPRVSELSGLATDGHDWYAINDGGDRVEVYVLGSDCAVRRVITAPLDPYDPEDLARGADGTLWLADTGDNSHKRTTVALIAVTPAGKATLYRLRYPDGPHDAEALLLAHDGTPYLVTKDPLGPAGVYRPVSGLTSPGPTPLRRVAAVRVGPTDTPGGPVPDSIGSVLVTGGAVSADGTVIALRTYTDVYLYRAPGGDVVTALRGKPVRIPLPDERQGEAIAFEPDGTLASAGEGVGQPLRLVSPANAVATARPAATTTTGVAAQRSPVSPAGSTGDTGWWLLVPVGAVIVGLAWVFTRRARRT